MDPRIVEARDVLISIAEDGDRLSRGEAVLRSDSVGPVLAAHGRYRYSAIGQRPDFNWPQGRRLAVYVGLNLEHFAFGDGLGAELCPGGPHPDVLNYAWRDYGNRVGVWRLIELFDELELPLSVLANSSIYHYCPDVMKAFRARGDEIVGHGRTNSERQGVLAPDQERQLIAEATDVIARAEGCQPRGWLGPWISQSRVTPDLLAEAGYEYLLDWCMDDQPVWFSTRSGGRILSVPYPQELNDISSIVGRKDSGEQFAAMITDTFEEMLAQSKRQSLVMGIALHPYLVGQPHRLRPLRRALQTILARRDEIWITTAGGIAAFSRALPDGIVPT
ncbi:Peptidoglycan/xylan/chitin deacetylase, PgdA/CDA1 family [Bradyrhizobium brasilense]|uniref:Peptidoglycan/xylan/chitin deacetylase, PgdA/CDA1 family n=1 Tax=Bradyrhizobium brasilense TaxID=1419277 RepID=A0A1G6QRD8_9BRAD|nr:polysaccharide deacetylase family protein [Bradyrhizobium brasilense]SDC94831.1 Peptidoglycan/xylan/chitin deacetylase, PgdA/CDA1 family [Bradyrhizobium brasilense]